MDPKAKQTAAVLMSNASHNGSHFDELLRLGVREHDARAIVLRVAVFREQLERLIGEAMPINVAGMTNTQAVTALVNRGASWTDAADAVRRMNLPAPDDDVPVKMRGGR